MLLCQAGAGSVKMGRQTGVRKEVVQDVLESAVQQSLVNTASAGNSATGEASCVCHICSAVLKNPLSLRSHIQGIHLAIKSRRCNICGESFLWRMQVTRHKKHVHGADGSQLLVR